MQIQAKNAGKQVSQQILRTFVRDPPCFGKKTIDELITIRQSLQISLQDAEELSEKKKQRFKSLISITNMKLDFRQESQHRSKQNKSKNEKSKPGWLSNKFGSMFGSSEQGQPSIFNGFGSKLINLFKKQESRQNLNTKQQEQEQFLRVQSIKKTSQSGTKLQGKDLQKRSNDPNV